MELAFTLGMIALAVACAWFSLGRAGASGGPHGSSDQDERPWRRVGAAICLLVSMMFALGLWLVDVPDHPRAYAAYWIIIMVLVMWLCGLAVKDVLFTRRKMHQWREQRLRLTRWSNPPRGLGGDLK